MSKSKEKRKKRQSTARRRAEQHTSGFETTMLKLPEGLSFWKAEKGIHTIDIIPYTVKGNTNPFAEDGELHYERTFYAYRGVGVDEKSYICSSKTFKKADYIQEWRTRESKRDEVDSDTLKSFNPKERQLFLIYDHKEPEKGLQLWEFSYFCFGQLLDTRIKNSDEDDDWDMFYFPDKEGKTLRIEIEEASGGGYKFTKASAIDFKQRKKELPDEIVNHGFCLDELLVETPYEELKSIFNGVSVSDDDAEDAEDEPEDEDEPKAIPPEDDEPEEEDSRPATAEDLNLSKGDSVNFNGEPHTILKISKDGIRLMLLDDDDEPVKTTTDKISLIKAEDEPDPEAEPEDEWDEAGEWD